MTNCRNCNTTITEKYCANCGQSAALKRIDSHYITHEVQHLLHFEKGFLFTVKELLLRPGQSIREYILDNRNRFIKPVPFLIFTSLIYTIINNWFHIEASMASFNDAGLSNPATGKSSINSLFLWVQNHYGYANILMGAIIAMLLKIFFRKYQYNIFEITVLLCFVMGEGMLLLALFSIFAGITKIKALFTIMGFAAFAYSTWAIGQFYGKGKVSSYFKAFLAYILGTGLFYVLLIIFGLLVDYIRK